MYPLPPFSSPEDSLTVWPSGVSLVQSGFEGWAGGSGDCSMRPSSGPYQVCPMVGAAHALPWGSAEYIGLGFLVFLTIILCERFGSPIMKSTAVVIGLLVGCIVAAACGYFDRSGIDSAPAASFIWVHTFPLSVYGPLVLPLLALYIVLAMEAIGGESDPLLSRHPCNLQATAKKETRERNTPRLPPLRIPA